MISVAVAEVSQVAEARRRVAGVAAALFFMPTTYKPFIYLNF